MDPVAGRADANALDARCKTESYRMNHLSRKFREESVSSCLPDSRLMQDSRGNRARWMGGGSVSGTKNSCHSGCLVFQAI